MLRCFPALAAVPPEDVVEGLHVIVDELTRMLTAGEIDRDWEPQVAGMVSLIGSSNASFQSSKTISSARTSESSTVSAMASSILVIP